MNQRRVSVQLAKLDEEEISALQARLRNQQDLSDLELTHRDLRYADFSAANLKGADFRNSDLSHAVFTDAIGFTPGQFAGANLTGAKMPNEIFTPDLAESVKDTSKNAGAIFLAMILTCSFLFLTAVSTRDIQLLANSGTAELPVIRLAVPTSVFFTVGPAVVLGQYIVFHLYLIRLWLLIGSLPAVYPDGVSQPKKVFPWLLTDLMKLGLPRLSHEPLGLLQRLVFLFSGFGLVPTTLLLVYLRCLCAHDRMTSDLHLGLLLVSLCWMNHAYRMMIHALRGEAIRPNARYWQRRVPALIGVTLIGASFYDLNLATLSGRAWGGRAIIGRRVDSDGAPIRNEKWRLCTWAVLLLDRQSFFLSDGNLADDQSRLPSTWKGSESLPADYMGVPRASFSSLLGQRNLRALMARGAFLANSDFRGAILDGSDLSEAELRGTVWGRKESLRYRSPATSLVGVELREANLSGTTIEGANMTDVDFEGANLSRCVIKGAILRNARLANANLRNATLTQINLTGVNFYGADLRGAWMGDCTGSPSDLNMAIVDAKTYYPVTWSRGHDKLFENGIYRYNITPFSTPLGTLERVTKPPTP